MDLIEALSVYGARFNEFSSQMDKLEQSNLEASLEKAFLVDYFKNGDNNQLSKDNELVVLLEDHQEWTSFSF